MKEVPEPLKSLHNLESWLQFYAMNARTADYIKCKQQVIAFREKHNLYS